MFITHCATFTSLEGLAGVTPRGIHVQSPMQVLDEARKQFGVLLRPQDEFIAATLYRGEEQIEGVSISLNDNYSDAEALGSLIEHLSTLFAVDWTDGVLFIMRGDPSDTVGGKFRAHIIEFDKKL